MKVQSCKNRQIVSPPCVVVSPRVQLGRQASDGFHTCPRPQQHAICGDSPTLLFNLRHLHFFKIIFFLKIYVEPSMGNSSFGKGPFDRKCSTVKESELVPCDRCPVCLQWNKRRNKIKL